MVIDEQIALVRRERLPGLGRLMASLNEATRALPIPEERVPALWMGISAQCAACSIHVSGEELRASGRPASDSDAPAKITRLRQGYCARQGCESFFYELTFSHCPGVDWTKLLEHTESILAEHERERDSEIRIREALWRVERIRLAGRVAAYLAAVALLFIAWQWHRGGTIPLIRQPENFRVDPLPSHLHGAPLHE